MVSVILPTYNGEKFIEKSIESVLSQTYSNLELIIVNDCSTDGTEQIINQYAKRDDRIRIITNKKNMGLPKSLNIGFHHAKGKFLTWTSDDNYYEEEAFEQMIKHLREQKADFVYAACNIIDAKDKIIGRSTTNAPEKLAKANCIWACFLYKRKVLQCIGDYNADLRLMEDYDYWLRVYEKGFRMYYIPRVLYNYRKHNKSLTSTKQSEIFLVDKRVRKLHIKKILFWGKGTRKEKLRDIYYMVYGLKSLSEKCNQLDYYVYIIFAGILKALFTVCYKEKI